MGNLFLFAGFARVSDSQYRARDNQPAIPQHETNGVELRARHPT